MNPQVVSPRDLGVRHQRSTFLESFWLSNNWKLNYTRAKLSSTRPIANFENPVMHLYCGPENLKPTPAYTSFEDINNGDFVLVRPHDPFLVLVWMGRTQSDVIKDDQNEFFKMVKVQWWVPMKKGSNLDE